MYKVLLQAPAKLNLSLDVTGIAPNGYHTVDMIMQTIGVYEQVEIFKSNGFSLRCPGSRVPTDERNTATQAAALFFRETGLLAGADIIIHKNIPTRAGMAGGSADAAAVLVGLNVLYGAQLSTGALCELGRAIGADVPFSVLGGTVRAEGIGEKLTPLSPLAGCWFVVVMPPGGVSTPEAYRRYDEQGSPVHPDVNAAAAALQSGQLAALLPYMTNALEHANGGKHTAPIRKALDAAGAAASLMTGSGAAVFGLFWDKASAETAAHTLQGQYPQVFLAPPVPHGARVVGTE